MRLKDYIIHPATPANSAAMIAYLDTIPDDSPEFYEYQEYNTPNGVNNDNALTYAIKTCQVDIVRKLLEKGANVNFCEDKTSFNLLHFSSFFADQSTFQENNLIINLLLDRNADVNALDTFGATPLHYAIEWCSPEVVDKFIQKGAKLNEFDKDGMYILTNAMLRGDDAIVTKLIQGGANPYMKNLDMREITDVAIDKIFGKKLDEDRFYNYKSLKNWGNFAFSAARRSLVYIGFSYVFGNIPLLSNLCKKSFLGHSKVLNSLYTASKYLLTSLLCTVLDQNNFIHFDSVLASPLNFIFRGVNHKTEDTTYIKNIINVKKAQQPIAAMVENRVQKHPGKFNWQDLLLATPAFKEYRQP